MGPRFRGDDTEEKANAPPPVFFAKGAGYAFHFLPLRKEGGRRANRRNL